MAILSDDRSPLDEALADSRATVLVLLGAEHSLAGRLHACATGDSPDCGPGIDDPWRHAFLVTDAGLLTDAERQAWLDSRDDRYAVLDRTTGNACGGPLSSLTVDGDPDVLEIKLAFADCEGGA